MTEELFRIGWDVTKIINHLQKRLPQASSLFGRIRRDGPRFSPLSLLPAVLTYLVGALQSSHYFLVFSFWLFGQFTGDGMRAVVWGCNGTSFASFIMKQVHVYALCFWLGRCAGPYYYFFGNQT
uniref:Uncharacterized protein n=1 Tax=Ditylenchus dipsaci TaxID=166011 RepID=A0A915DQQ4_9BILA